MSRQYCNLCQRPQVSCICHLVCLTKNLIKVVILQHPSEVKQSKGTVALLSRSLAECQVLEGEDFQHNAVLQQLIEKYQGKVALVYPSEQAIEISQTNNETGVSDIQCIILLDGTWKKAYRLYMMNPALHHLIHLQLPQSIEGRYQIRSTNKKGALSTLEACCHSLALLESNAKKYQRLFASFDEFNQMQLSFGPKRNQV